MLSTNIAARRFSPFGTVFPHLYALLTVSLFLGLSSRLTCSQDICSRSAVRASDTLTSYTCYKFVTYLLWRDGLVVSALDQRPRGRGFESVGCGLSCSNRGPVALCTLRLGLLNPPSSRGRLMSTGYSWEGIRQVRATLLGAPCT